MNWDLISNEQNLSEGFIKEYQEDLNWDIFSASQHMNYLFIHEYIDFLNIEQMKQNPHLSYLSKEKWDRIEQTYAGRLETYMNFSNPKIVKTSDAVDVSVDVSFHPFFHSFRQLEKKEKIQKWVLNLHIQEHDFYDFRMYGLHPKDKLHHTYTLSGLPCTKKEMHTLKQSVAHFLRRNECEILTPFL